MRRSRDEIKIEILNFVLDNGVVYKDHILRKVNLNTIDLTLYLHELSLLQYIKQYRNHYKRLKLHHGNPIYYCITRKGVEFIYNIHN